MIPERPPSKIGIWKGLGLAFCCCHAAFLCYSLVPAAPTQVAKGHPALDFYRVAVSGRQQWNLLDTIPAHHSLDVRFEGFDKNGTKYTAGSVLPGLKPYPKPEDIRYYGLFYQLIFASDKAAYRDAYLQKAAQALTAEGSSQVGVDWSLLGDAEYTRTLVHSRRDGRMWLPMPTRIPLGHAPGTPP